MKKFIVDTNVLLSGKQIEEYEKMYVPITVLDELEAVAEYGNTEEKKIKAREAISYIANNIDKIEVVVEITPVGMYTWLNLNTQIGATLMYAAHIVNNLDFEATFLTVNLSTYEKAKTMKIDTILI